MAIRLALISTLLALAVPASAYADAIAIKGSFGNKDGCAYAKSQESTGSDDFFLLTKDDVTTAASVCTFGKTIATSKGTITVAVTCEDEGDTSQDVVDVVPVKSGYSVVFKDGTKWGPLAPCK